MHVAAGTLVGALEVFPSLLYPRTCCGLSRTGAEGSISDCSGLWFLKIKGATNIQVVISEEFCPLTFLDVVVGLSWFSSRFFIFIFWWEDRNPAAPSGALCCVPFPLREDSVLTCPRVCRLWCALQCLRAVGTRPAGLELLK